MQLISILAGFSLNGSGDPVGAPIVSGPPRQRPALWMADVLTGLIVVTTVFQFVSNYTNLNVSIEKVGLIKSEVRDGAYWRLLTGCLVHGSPMHILFSASALRGFGRDVEYLGGKWALALGFLLSMISGNLFSLFLHPDANSVGASGGILGLLGYLLMYVWRHKRVLPPGIGKGLLFNLGLVAVMGFLMRGIIDNWAHFGGLVAGCVFGLVAIPRDSRQLLAEEAGWVQIAGKGAFGILVLTAGFAIFKMFQR